MPLISPGQVADEECPPGEEQVTAPKRPQRNCSLELSHLGQRMDREEMHLLVAAPFPRSEEEEEKEKEEGRPRENSMPLLPGPPHQLPRVPTP